jgi:hypothetical protein
MGAVGACPLENVPSSTPVCFDPCSQAVVDWWRRIF